MDYLHNLDETLLAFSKKPRDIWKIGDAVKGTFIIGGSGSGKSSGSGKTIAKAYLQAGFGGLVLCAKPEEAAVWRKYCQETGREKSLIVMDGSGERRFNFLDYELSRIDAGSYKTPLAVEVFMKIYEALKTYANASKSGGGGGENSFWSDSVRLLLSHSIDALYFARGRLKLAELMRFIREAPAGYAETQKKEYLDSYHYQIMEAASVAVDASGDPDKIAIMEAVADWFFSFYDLDKKTRSNILATLESMVLDFTKGDIAKIFCTDTNIVPEMSQHGAVIVLDFPLKKWQRGGIIAQSIFKYAWQRALERRGSGDDSARPCFLWCDEYQFFTSSYDPEFQSTARSAKACTVYLTQSLPALRDAVNSPNPKDSVDNLLNNFATRIIHTCLDDTTKTWAADAIGKSLQERYGRTQSTSEGVSIGTSENTSTGSSNGYNAHLQGSALLTEGSGVGRNYGSNRGSGKGSSEGINKGSSEGVSTHQVIDYDLQPAFFGSGLRMGGRENNFIVDGVVLMAGKVWEHTGSTFLVCSFPQK